MEIIEPRTLKTTVHLCLMNENKRDPETFKSPCRELIAQSLIYYDNFDGFIYNLRTELSKFRQTCFDNRRDIIGKSYIRIDFSTQAGEKIVGYCDIGVGVSVNLTLRFLETENVLYTDN